MRRVNLARRLWAYQAWKTSGEGGGLAGSLGALLDRLVHQVVPLEVREGSLQDGEASDCGGNRQDGVRWGRRAGGRRMGREGEETLEEAAPEKREDLENQNERQILYLIHSHQMLVILTMIVIRRGCKARGKGTWEEEILRGTRGTRGQGRNLQRASFTTLTLQSLLLLLAAVPFLTISPQVQCNEGAIFENELNTRLV